MSIINRDTNVSHSLVFSDKDWNLGLCWFVKLFNYLLTNYHYISYINTKLRAPLQ